MFSMYIDLGFEHITDLNGYDHILFLIALAAVYLLKDWKKVLILITAFTIGHTVTLALATLKLIKVPINLIEFLIPVTIFISAFSDFFYKKNINDKRLHHFKYVLAMFFGLIHGMGFSNYLINLLGTESNIVMPLFAFNVGLELGQIIIIIAYLVIASIFVKYLKVLRRDLSLIVAGAAFGISIILMIERFPF
ncbi:MAG: HupE/UreJ family protein [Bacteroidales bacterium]|nr:HupE/UreJ family protein [Bacteroidales bacterium]